MTFREWLNINEAGKVFGRVQGNTRYHQQNTDPPLNRILPAVGHGLADSLMQSQRQSGAEIQSSPSIPSRDKDELEDGEILNPQGVTRASLPLQINRIIHSGTEVTPTFSLAKMRTIDKMDGDPATDGLYIKYDPDKHGSVADAIEHTTRLADEKLKELMMVSGEINKVDPKPVQKDSRPNNKGVLEIVYQFKPKKGGK